MMNRKHKRIIERREESVIGRYVKERGKKGRERERNSKRRMENGV